MQLRLFMLFLPYIIISCNNNSVKPTEEIKATPDSNEVSTTLVFDQLVGTWQSEDGKTFERWTKINDETYSSVVYSIKDNDTSWNEEGKVYPENKIWIFENLVKGQNSGKSIRFSSTLLNDKTVQFSNPAHDFPTDINYTLPDRNTINAFIVGPNSKGGKDTIPYNYKRVK